MLGGLRSPNLFQSDVQAPRDSPIGIVLAKFLQVGNIADLIALARLFDAVSVELVHPPSA